MKAYKLEVWVTTVCLILVSITGGFLSAIFIIANTVFFNQVDVPAALAGRLDTFFVPKYMVMGFPLHYFLLIMFSWIGVTLLGAIWCLVMDKLEEQQRA